MSRETEKKLFDYTELNREKRDPAIYGIIPRDYIYKEPMTNFVSLSPITKITILDTIIDKSTAVFGPYGGLYGEIEADIMVGQDKYKEGNYVKSKDGHNFFKSLTFNSKYAQTIMTAVQQLTKYISGYEGDTSRDGTTSLSIVGCNVAKELLISRLDKPQIPSTIHNIVFDIVRSAGTSAIEKFSKPVYNPRTVSYIDGGEKMILDAINTTVDSNPIYAEAFSDLMKKCSANKYDILNAVPGSPNYRHGSPKIEIDFKAGVKFRGECISKDVAGGFKDRLSPTFVLDGLIKAPNRDVFVYQFKQWVKVFLGSFKTEDGKSRFGKWGDMTPPLFIITKKPDYLMEIYMDMMLKGIQMIYSDGSSEVIKPHFMFAIETEMFEVYFNDIRAVFPEMFIDLNLINKYIDANKTTKAEMMSSGVRAHAKPQEVDIKDLFPRWDGEQLYVAIPYTEIEEDQGLPDSVEQPASYSKVRSTDFPLDMVMFETNWDGQAISLAPTNNEHLARAKKHREDIQMLADSYADTALEANELKQRLEFFSGVTLKPTIYFRGADEGKQMFDLYEDALGVFASVHKFGVMPGANIFMLKANSTVFDKVYGAAKDEFANRGILGSKAEVYLDFVTDLWNSIILGYEESVRLLDHDKNEAEDIINGVRNELNDNILIGYNIVTGQWTDEIVEAAKTTAEVFAGALSIAKDMLELRTIRVLGSGAEYNDAMENNKEMRLLPKYKIYEEEVEGESK